MKTSLNYKDVVEIANALHAAGNPDPGSKAIRKELVAQRGEHASIGSLTTIQKHLEKWRVDCRPRDVDQPSPQLPPAIGNALLSWVNGAIAKVEAPLKAQIDRISEELAVAVDEAVHLEGRVDSLVQEIEERARERDEARGERSARKTEVADLKVDLGAAQERGVNLGRDLTVVQSECKALARRAEEVGTESERRDQAAQEGIRALRSQLDAVGLERNEAREMRAKAEAALAGETRRASQAESRESALQAEVQQLKERATKLAGELDSAKTREYEGKVRVVELVAQVQSLQLPASAIGVPGTDLAANEPKGPESRTSKARPV
ncbi:MAG: DNA-binding protein [Pseudomonadota bacterium]